LLTLHHADTPQLLANLQNAHIEATTIGKVVEADKCIKLRTAAGTKDLPQFERDELARFLDD